MIKKLLKYKTFGIVCLLSIVITLVAVGHWFYGGKVLYFWDAYVPFDAKNSLELLFYTWNEGIFPGYTVIGWTWLPYWALFFLPSLVIPSLSNGQFFVYTLILSLTVINFYLLTVYILKIVFKEKSNELMLNTIALAVAILYTFNVFTFFNFYFMFNPGAFILSLLPLNILSLIKIYPIIGHAGIRKNIWLSLFFISLVGMVPGFTVYVFFLQYLVWTLVYLLIFWFISNKKILSRFTLSLVIFYSLVILVNLWWFIPALINLQNSYSTQSSFGTSVWFDMGFKNVQLINSMRFLGSALMNNQFPWSPFYENVLFTIPLFIFPLLFILGIFSIKKNTKSLFLFFLGMVLVSLFIVKFSNPPFSWILGFAFHHVPFFGGFRDSFQKAGIYFILPYFIFIALGVTLIVEETLRRGLKILLFIFFAVFLAGSIVLSGPFFLFAKDNTLAMPFSYDGKKYSFKAKTQVPPEYYDLKTFLEGKCQGKTILTIPRSGFVTDGVWEKYGTSYAGQDIVAGLINCNFLSTAMFEAYSEAAIQIPYLSLQNGDYGTFKKYLFQNDINLLLIRKDFIPTGFITWTYVDGAIAEELLSKDKNFSKIFSNDYFSVFEKKSSGKGSYGFNLTNNVVSTQANQNTGSHSTILSGVLGTIKYPVILTLIEDYEKYKGQINLFSTISNCIGCVNIDTEEFLKQNKITKFDMVKKIIKTYVLKRDTNLPQEILISIKIIDANNIYKKLIVSIDNKNINDYHKNVNDYIKTWKEIEESFNEYKGDKFESNNKLIEMSNFINIQKNTTLRYLTSDALDDKELLSNPDARASFVSLYSFQAGLYKIFSKGLIITEFSKGIIKSRIDIPAAGDYSCNLINIKNNADINSLKIEDERVNFLQDNSFQKNFNKGSFLADILFTPREISKFPNFALLPNVSKEINIGNLKPGKYTVGFSSNSTAEGNVIMVITRGKIKTSFLKSFHSINNPGEGILLLKSFNYGENVFQNSFIFGVDLPESRDIFVYFFSLNSKNLSIDINNLKLSTYLEEGDIEIVCTTRLGIKKDLTNEIKITKKSPVYYKVTLPENYEGFLVFKQTFDKDWIAYEEKNGKELPHLRTGYANAWYIDNPKNREIIVEYKKQKLVHKGAVIAFALVITVSFLYLKIRKNENS